MEGETGFYAMKIFLNKLNPIILYVTYVRQILQMESFKKLNQSTYFKKI
ncbi:hypothetical protein MARINOS108_11489 [Marinoscillum sp. 108]|nr:hypothetical protein MARINOS108_11489 [Marinoscillum sp. 108]